jgi:pimeloyl-ACP methyl ester carboxylesterase
VLGAVARRRGITSLTHRPAGPPLGAPSVVVPASPDDRLVPIRGVRATARRYGARLVEFPGMGHDLMLDAGSREPLATMLGWLESEVLRPVR